VQLLQYAAGEVRAQLPLGAVRLGIETGYPHDGRVTVTVREAPPGDWGLTLRVPGWAVNATVAVDDGAAGIAPIPGVTLRGLRAGSRVVLELPVTARWTAPDSRIDAVRGSLAVERGPLVMCVESVDVRSGRPLDELRVDPGLGLRDDDGRVAVAVRWPERTTDAWPYGPLGRAADHHTVSDHGAEPEWLELVPYHRWANRGPATMRVWLPVVR
jgi:DUF1680 family protein